MYRFYIFFRVFLTVAHCTLSELDGINAALKQSQGIGSIKQILLRKDLQQKVKQYDSKLSNVVQRFQVCRRLTNPNHSSQLAVACRSH